MFLRTNGPKEMIVEKHPQCFHVTLKGVFRMLYPQGGVWQLLWGIINPKAPEIKPNRDGQGKDHKIKPALDSNENHENTT